MIGKSQVSSVSSGDWTTPGIWTCNCVPDFNLGIIRIDPTHNVTVSTTINADEIVVSGDATLIIATGGQLIVRDGLGNDLVQEQADGNLTFIDGAVTINSGGILENRGQIAELTASMIFVNGSEYQHNQNGNAIPTVTWQAGSTCRITGWGNSSATSSFRGSLNQSFHHFIWDSPGQTNVNVQLLGSLTTVNGNLTVNNTNNTSISNKQISIGGNNASISILGDFTVTNTSRASIAVSGGGTYTINVGGHCNFSSINVGTNHYQIGGSGSTGVTTLNVTGDLTLGSGQLNLAPGAGTGNINVGGGITLTGGSVIKSGAGTGNVSFTGAVTHNLVGGSGSFSAGNLSLQSGTLNITGTPLAMGGNLTIQNGTTLNMPAALSASGNIQFVAGSIINSNAGTLTLTGGTAQTIAANGATLNNITVNRTADVTLTSTLSLTGLLSMTSTSTIFNSNGFLQLFSTSDAASGNASIGPIANLSSIAGNVIVQRFMSSEGRIYRYLSSPVANATIASLQDDFPVTGAFPQSSVCAGCTTNPSLFYYNAVTAAYVAYPVSIDTEPLLPGRGYAAYVRQTVLPGPVTVDVTGPINQGLVSLPVFHGSAPSWNLVGNPYPSSINWNSASGWTKTNINGSIAIQDNGVGGGGYRYWNGSSGSGIGGGLTNGEIATGQAFWVETTAASPVLTATEPVKVTNTAIFYRTKEIEINTLAITVNKGELNDMTVFQIHEEANSGFDNYDASKRENDNFDFSTRFQNSNRYAINAINKITCGTELFLDLRFTKSTDGSFVMDPLGTYSMNFKVLGTAFDNFVITLTDKFTGSKQVITNNSIYNFTITNAQSSLASDRFQLFFGVKDPEISVEEDDILVSSSENGNQWFFNNEKIAGATSKTLRADRSGLYKLEVTIDACVVSHELDYLITAIEEDEGSLIQVYPNPTSKEIFIKMSGLDNLIKSISVTNILGQQVGSVPISFSANEQTGYLNMEYLNSGIYFLKVVLPKETFVYKIIKR